MSHCDTAAMLLAKGPIDLVGRKGEVALAKGIHPLTLIVDRRERSTPLTVEVFEPSNSTARGKPVAGP